MNMTLELDIEKNQNKSLIRAFFNRTNSPILSEQFHFEYNKKMCFSHIIHVMVNKFRLIFV
jgi:hypothetical protein